MSKEIHTRYVISLSDLRSEDYVVVGESVYNDYYLIKSGINIPQGFVLTKMGYDDFLLDNEVISLFSKLLEKKDLSKEHLLEISNMIRKAIEGSILNEEIKAQIKNAFNLIFGKGKNTLLAISPSFIFQKHSVDANYYKTFIVEPTNFEEIFEYIKKIYLTFYSPELIESRLNNDFQISCFAVVIRQVKNFEVSGKVTILKTKFNKNESFDIEAQYGNLNMTDNDSNLFSDIYSIDPGTFKILHRKIIDQEYTFSKKGKESIKIEVANEWKGKQKLQDHKILEVIEAVKKLDEIYKRPIQVYWGYEKGNLYIISINYFHQPELELNTLSDLPIENSSDTSKRIQEIQDTLSNSTHTYTKIELANNLTATTNVMVKDKSMLLARLRGGFGINTALLDSNANIYFEQQEFNYTDSNILRNSNSNGFLNGNTIINQNKFLTDRIDQDVQKEIIDRFTIEIASLSYQFYPKMILYQTSDINTPIQDEVYLKRILTEAIALRNVKEDYDYPNLGICISSISTIENLKYILNILEKLRLKSSKDFKIYCEISSASLLFDIDELADEHLSMQFDGFLVSVDKLMVSLFNKVVFYNDDRNLFQKIFKEKLEKLKNKKFNYIFRLVNNSPDLIDNILALNPFGLVLPYSRTDSI